MNGDDKKYKILIVDDIPKNIQVLASNLNPAFYSVAFATSGETALKYTSSTLFDLVLLDVSMPGMDGYEVCRQIKSNAGYKDIPVIFITAFNDKENIVKGFHSGAVDYIAKPFNTEELLARINTHLELKDKRDKIASMNEILESKVRERTEELQNANVKLNVLQKAKSDFLTLISHELRTPLTGIKGFAEILNETVQENESKEYIKYLNDSADRLIRFSEAALLITSLKANNIELDPTEINIYKILEDLLQLTEDQLNKKDLTVELRVPEENFFTKGDYQLIKKAVHNVLDNAVRFSKSGKKIVIDLHSENNFTVISIADQGPGFSEEALKEIFNFFSTHDVLFHSEGFGLGLAATKLILDLHQGKIEVANNHAGGARVNIYLPKTD